MAGRVNIPTLYSVIILLFSWLSMKISFGTSQRKNWCSIIPNALTRCSQNGKLRISYTAIVTNNAVSKDNSTFSKWRLSQILIGGELLRQIKWYIAPIPFNGRHCFPQMDLPYFYCRIDVGDIMIFTQLLASLQ